MYQITSFFCVAFGLLRHKYEQCNDGRKNKWNDNSSDQKRFFLNAIEEFPLDDQPDFIHDPLTKLIKISLMVGTSS